MKIAGGLILIYVGGVWLTYRKGFFCPEDQISLVWPLAIGLSIYDGLKERRNRG